MGPVLVPVLGGIHQIMNKKFDEAFENADPLEDSSGEDLNSINLLLSP